MNREVDKTNLAIWVLFDKIPPTWANYDSLTWTDITTKALDQMNSAGMVELRESCCLRLDNDPERYVEIVLTRSGQMEASTWYDFFYNQSIDGWPIDDVRILDSKRLSLRLTDKGVSAAETLRKDIPELSQDVFNQVRAIVHPAGNITLESRKIVQSKSETDRETETKLNRTPDSRQNKYPRSTDLQDLIKIFKKGLPKGKEKTAMVREYYEKNSVEKTPEQIQNKVRQLNEYKHLFEPDTGQ